MNKVCASILVFIALFALVGADNLKRIPLNQGVLRMRNLATTTTPKYNFDNYTNNFAVPVNMSSTYLTAASIDKNAKTDMLLFLYTNVTGFTYGYRSSFLDFGCESNNCSYDDSQTQKMFGPHFTVSRGYPFNFSNLTIGNDNSAWQLKTSALYAYYMDTNYVWCQGSNQNYIRNSSTYGWIGLGVGGNASKNFQTTTPIFSIQVNTSGVGSLIFGKDTTLYDSKRTAITLTTDTNWAMVSRNMSMGPLINNTNFISSVIFDLQFPGLGVPDTYYDNIWNMLTSKYNVTYNTTLGNTDYTYTYNGSLANLPELIFGLTNDKNITLPPAAYTRQLATNFYAILIGRVSRVTNQTSGDSVNYTVLGWPALSQFYTVFELPTTNIPTVTMYPTYNASANGVVDSTSSSFSLKTLAIVAAVVLVVLVALSAVCKKKADFTKSDLGVELRAARV